MRTAIAFAAIIVIFGIFMPDVLHAMTSFLLAFFNKGIAFLNALPVGTADMSRAIR